MIVYRATNKQNDKQYVGKTTSLLDARRRAHLYSASNGSQSHFHLAIVKWGENSFFWEILEESSTEEELSAAEIRWIDELDTYKSGYNQTLGGEGVTGWKPSEETRVLWSEQRKGKNQYTQGYKAPARPVLTEQESAEKRKKANQARSEKLKGRTAWNKGKTGWQAEAGIDTKKSAAKAQESRRKSGYVWTIEAHDLDGNLLGSFSSQSAAAKNFGFCPKVIRRKMNGAAHKGVFFTMDTIYNHETPT